MKKTQPLNFGNMIKHQKMIFWGRSRLTRIPKGSIASLWMGTEGLTALSIALTIHTKIGSLQPLFRKQNRKKLKRLVSRVNPQAHQSSTATIKRLVVCCDGTWQDLEQDYPTNVVKTVQIVKPVDSEGINQVCLLP